MSDGAGAKAGAGAGEHADGLEAIARARDLEVRLAHHEERLAHHERAHDELSDMVRAQQVAIVKLLDVVERLEAAVDSGGAAPADMPPPHY